MDDSSKFRLDLGCWRGTTDSRDFAMPRYLDTEKEAREIYQSQCSLWAEIGFSPYCCSIITPNGKKIDLP
jgi:hypothetical protein